MTLTGHSNTGITLHTPAPASPSNQSPYTSRVKAGVGKEAKAALLRWRWNRRSQDIPGWASSERARMQWLRMAAVSRAGLVRRVARIRGRLQVSKAATW